ncbi:MAG: tetratricopeptide repeat protein [Prevotella sp.]|nr:tetratricopeptide repeat protein [Prevotella sp.]
MKTAKYIIIGAMMTVISVPTMAQDATSAIEQATKIIKSGAEDKDKQVTAVFKTVKKDAKAVAGIGRAYLDAKEYDNADKYADLAIKANKNCAAGYVLKGDICVMKDDGGAASSWFENATTLDPQDPEGYRRYAQINAKADPDGSIAKLEQLRSIDPSYPVDLVAAEIQSKAGRADAAIEYYSKVDLDKMEDYQLADYASTLFLKQKYDESLKVSSFGNNKFPRYGSLNRLSLLNNVNLEKYEEAIKFGDRLFNSSDDVKYTALDYINYGTALQKLKKNDEAIKAFEKVVNTRTFDMEQRISVFKNLSDVYKSMGDYPKALEYYEKYVKGNQTKMTANIKNGLAQLYRTMAIDENSTPEQKQEAVAKADKVFSEIAEEFPAFKQAVTAQRAKLPFILDPEDKAGAAKPHYDQLIEIINGLESKDASDVAQLKQALSYNIVYFVKVNEDIAKAKEYAAKLLEIDPENAMAKQVSELQ